MFVVIFEVNPRPERWDDYLRHASILKPELQRMDGFIDNERFSSRRRPGWLVSLSSWRDEKSLIRWRSHGLHHGVQEKGRSEVFRDYHLRVGEVAADNGLVRMQLPGQRLDLTETGTAPYATLSVARQGASPPLEEAVAAMAPEEWDMFESIAEPGKLLVLAFWRQPPSLDALPAAASHRLVRVIRDYGMFDRAEAPQYYPPVTPG